MLIKIQQPRQDSESNFNFNLKYGHFYVWLRGIGHISSWFDRHILYLTPQNSAGLQVRLAEHIYIAHHDILEAYFVGGGIVILCHHPCTHTHTGTHRSLSIMMV